MIYRIIYSDANIFFNSISAIFIFPIKKHLFFIRPKEDHIEEIG